MSSFQNNTSDSKIKELQYQLAVYEDETAYKALFFHLFPPLQNLAFSITHSRVLAEEIASDLLMDVWTRRKHLQTIENLKLYLFVGAKHAAIAKLKLENKRTSFSFEDLQVEFISDYANPDVSAELHELQEKIARVVKGLPPSCQLIYKLAKEDRLKYKEIAELLNLSVKTIDHQLSIALKKIAGALHISQSKKNRP